MCIYLYQYIYFLTLPLPGGINFKFLLQPHQKYYITKNLAFHSLLKCKTIMLPILTTSLILFLLRWLGAYSFWAWKWKGCLLCFRTQWHWWIWVPFCTLSGISQRRKGFTCGYFRWSLETRWLKKTWSSCGRYSQRDDPMRGSDAAENNNMYLTSIPYGRRCAHVTLLKAIWNCHLEWKLMS